MSIENTPIVNNAYASRLNQGAKIEINTSVNVSVNTMDDSGNVQFEAIPAEIVLGHELIHATSYQFGYDDLSGKQYTYTFTDYQGFARTKTCPNNEAWTVELDSHVSYNDYNENLLRQEFGYNQRIGY